MASVLKNFRFRSHRYFQKRKEKNRKKRKKKAIETG
jgi:hypothetical protein